MGEVTEIDGSVLEGGGQILRLTMSFSSLLKKPIKITKIRANRSKGGLRPQHLKGIELACEMCAGVISGAVLESTEVTFYPNEVKSGKFIADTKTAGSISLLMQIALPIALFGPSSTSMQLLGGTNADMAPPVDYTINVFIPILKKFGGICQTKILRRGFYPKGGGIVEVQVEPVKILSAVNLIEFGSVTRVWGRSYVAGVLPADLAHKMANTAYNILRQTVPRGVHIDIEQVKETPQDAVGNGSGIVLFAETDTGCILGGSALGSRGVNCQEVGMKAAEELATSIKGKYCVDSYSQDQIIILMALARGKSIIKCGSLTEHTRTAIYVVEKLTNVKFTVEKTSASCIIQCVGMGLKNKYLEIS